MSLAEFVRLLRRGVWLIALAVLLGLVLGLTFSALQPPSYQTTATLLITATPQTALSDGQNANLLAQSRAQLLAQLAVTDDVLQSAQSQLGGEATLEQLRERVSANATDSTNFTTVTATAGSPQVAVDEAEAVVSALQRIGGSLDDATTSTGQSVGLVIDEVTPPALPTRAYSPQPRNYALVGAIVGLALALIVLIVRSAISQRVRSTPDLQSLAPGMVVTAVERPSGRAGRRIDDDEAYRTLRATLLPLLAAPSSVAIVGADGAGVEDLGRRLAASIEEVGGTAIVVDARLRPAAAPHRAGSRRAEAQASGDAAGRIVPFADLSSHSADLVARRGGQALADPAFGAHLAAAAMTARYVLVLLPPVTEQVSAAAAAATADAVVLQVDASRATRGEVLLALQRLRSAGVREIIGTLVGVSRADALPPGTVR